MAVIVAMLVIRRAPGPGRVRSSIIISSTLHKSSNRFFYSLLLDLSSIPRAREGAPGGLPAPKSVGETSCLWSEASCARLLATLLGSFSLLLALLGLHLLFLPLLSHLFCDLLWIFNLRHLKKQAFHSGGSSILRISTSSIKCRFRTLWGLSCGPLGGKLGHLGGLLAAV